MYIIDTELKKLETENRPIRIGLIGAGFAARGLALQLLTAAYGMRLVAISNRTLSNAVLAYTDALGDKAETIEVKTQQETDEAIKAGKLL